MIIFTLHQFYTHINKIIVVKLVKIDILMIE